MKFEKYHGLGNDFIIFNMEDVKERDLSELAKKVCHRNFGIGADGMMVYEKKDDDIIMNFYNADGTTAPMCGNGIRCFTEYMKNNDYFVGDRVEVVTGAGMLEITWSKKEEEFLVKVNMGKPVFEGKSIPIVEDVQSYLDKDIEVLGQSFKISSLFMGTTHSVIFVDDLNGIDIEKVGPAIERHNLFPVGTNVNFCEIKSRDELHVTTWERGAGMTLACGTGACAAVVVGEKLNRLDSSVKVVVPGGNLYIDLKEEVFMTGPSEKIASGEYLG